MKKYFVILPLLMTTIAFSQDNTALRGHVLSEKIKASAQEMDVIIKKNAETGLLSKDEHNKRTEFINPLKEEVSELTTLNQDFIACENAINVLDSLFGQKIALNMSRQMKQDNQEKLEKYVDLLNKQYDEYLAECAQLK